MTQEASRYDTILEPRGAGGLGALILTGGASSRMGADKAALDWGGRRAVDRLWELAREAGAGPAFCVGAGDLGLPRVCEAAPGCGPVGALLAGAQALRAAGAARALVLAVDAPTLTLSDLAPLLAAAPPGASYAGLPLPLVIDLDALPADAAADSPLRALVSRSGARLLTFPKGALGRLRGANTPDERAALLAQLDVPDA